MARIVDESFEPTTPDGYGGTGYEENWTETVVSGDTLDEDAALPGTPPPGAGSQCLKTITIGGVRSTYAAQVKTNQNISYIRGYLYISEEGLSNGQFLSTLELDNSSGAIVCRIQFSQNSGVFQVRFLYYSNGAYQSTAWVNVSLNTYYRFEYRYDLTNLLWEWKIDGNSQNNGSLTGTTLTPDRIRVGAISNGSAQSTIYADLVVWDDAGWVGAAGDGTDMPWILTQQPFPHKNEVIGY